MKKISAILARASRPTQSLESQISDLKTFAENNGYEVPDNFIFSEKISGIDAGFKKSLNSLLKALDNKDNKIEAVLIWEITRLNRGAYDFVLELSEINARNVPVYFYDINLWTWDFEKNEISKENCDQLVGAAHYGRIEWKKIAKRTKRGRDDLARKGYYVGHLADGYIAVKDGEHKKIDIDIKRSEVIKRIFNLYIDGHSTDEIAQILNAENVPTTNKYRLLTPSLFKYSNRYKKNGLEYERMNSKWSGSIIGQILANQWYIGKREYNGTPYEIKRIISDKDWEKVVDMRKKRAAQFRSNRKRKKHNYLLSNFFYCGKCGQKMYGHYTGLNNHYYCSSFDDGEKCGLRGINKENVEAIIIKTILFRALNEVVRGEKGIMSDFFKISEDEKGRLKNELKNREIEIKAKKKSLDELDEREKNYLSMISDPQNKKRVSTLYELLDENDNLRERTENELIELQSEIIQLNKRIRISENIKKIADNIASLKDLSTYRKLIENAVKRIEVYNIDKSISYLKIIYINEKEDGMLYSYPLLKNKYIYLNNKILKDDHIIFDGKSPEMKIEKGYYIVFNYLGNSFMALDNKGLKEELNKGPEWGKERIKEYYSNTISVRDFVLHARKGYPFLWEYDNSLFIEENDERKAEQEVKYKEWRKKFNNGLPTTLPYVVKDGNYEEYLEQRKHLYNRKYKIKKNKSLTDEQKAEELERIDEALSLLRAKVKYLSRDEAVKKYKEQRK